MAIYNLQPTKVCSKCGIEKPARKPIFGFHRHLGILRISASCRACTSIVRRRPRGVQMCRDCSDLFRPSNNFQLICRTCFAPNVRRIKAAAESARRARNRGARGRYRHSEFLVQCHRQDWRCAYCQKHLCEKTATRDHVIPLSRGGSNGIANIVLACSTCNSRKHTMTGDEFRRKLARP